MSSRALSLLVAGAYAGTVMSERGNITFRYDAGYSGPDISVSMPRGSSVFPDAVVRPWLLGLLPDNRLVRKAMAEPMGASPDDVIALLGVYGEDCPGAGQFCVPGEEARLTDRAGELRLVSPREIRARLSRATDAEMPSWYAERENWSLGGNQAKLALRRVDSDWYRCVGSAATTHIVKPCIANMNMQALDEFVCMKLAEEVEVASARCDYIVFDGMPAIVSERYDRFVGEDGGIRRIHQEDLCQALSIPPARKYTMDGGPTAQDVLELLKQDISGNSADRFVEALLFNYLIGATDGHAKNYSILHTAGSSWILAPLYDIASAFPYERRDGKPWCCAMSIGGENRLGWLRGSAIARFERAAGAPEGAVRNVAEELTSIIPDALATVFDRYHEIDGLAELRVRLEKPIVNNCRKLLRNIDVSGREIDLK